MKEKQNSFILLLFITLIIGSLQSLRADEYQIETHFCFGNINNVIVEGRVVEKHFLTPSDTNANDGTIKNIWRKLSQFFNEEEEGELVYLNLPNGLFKTETDDEGYFRFDVRLRHSIGAGTYPIQLWLGDYQEEFHCQLFIVAENNQFGVISDFDDTVIVSDVTNKVRLLSNTFTKNYTQREAVEGMAEFYSRVLTQYSLTDLSPLIFVTGSPRQIQESIEGFLNLNKFPARIVITKKLNGSNSDPLFDQFTYKKKKIEELFNLFNTTKFLLVGDDGEKDPEVYQYFQERYPQRVIAVWIRQVSENSDREKYSNQYYFKTAPKNCCE